MQQRVPHNLRAWYRAATFRGNLPVASAPAFFSVMAYRLEVDVAFACGIPARLVVEHARLALDTACRALFEADIGTAPTSAQRVPVPLGIWIVGRKLTPDAVLALAPAVAVPVFAVTLVAAVETADTGLVFLLVV